jgi:Zn-dependent metalloprotease
MTLTEHLKPFSKFLEAEATVTVAGELFGDGSQEQEHVRDASRQVGVLG